MPLVWGSGISSFESRCEVKNANWTWIIIGLAVVGGYYAYTASTAASQPKG